MVHGRKESSRVLPAKAFFDTALAHADAGRPDLALGALHQAIGTEPPRDYLRLLYRFAAVVFRATGDFASASQATQTAYDLALATGDAAKIGPALVAIADDAIDNGRFASAGLLLDQALKVEDPPTQLLTQLTQARLGISTGNLSAARRALELANARPYAARLDQPLFYMCLQKMLQVTVDNLTSHSHNTLALCRGIKAAYATRDRHAILFDVIGAWALAVGGKAQEAMAIVTALVDEVEVYPKYVEFRADVYAHVGHVLFAAGEVDGAREYFEKSLLTCPVPGHLPRILYFLGLSHIRLGHADAAASHFKRLVEVAGETAFAGLARELLSMQDAKGFAKGLETRRLEGANATAG